MSTGGWIGVDFDGTLAQYGTWIGHKHAGEPVVVMVDRVKAWLESGYSVRIFTARIHPLDMCVPPEHSWVAHRMALAANNAPEHIVELHNQAIEAVETVQTWCLAHLGQVLPVTNVKDYGMVELYDDRCVQVRPNTGVLVGESTRGLE